MIMTSIVVSLLFTIIVLWLTLITISKGYGLKHTIDPLNEGDEVREYTDKGDYRVK
ncbi:YtzI protein [Ornithinibacillus gellani]|uniref:YtzI protein n=1 Tax=Ornithinibacillus gellani TaxID=2293253 RepID=UPI000F4983DF|nr:YtzI protein [Ornithinibacillus gellani]TQS75920.1 YtzI protein [Ornithinibacillus gellani]